MPMSLINLFREFSMSDAFTLLVRFFYLGYFKSFAKNIPE